MQRMLEQAHQQGVVPEYTAQLLSGFSKRSRNPLLETPALIEPLSERELEILRLIADGSSTGETAGKLMISIVTVRNHLQNIYTKLQVHTRLQAAQRARELGLF